MEKNSLYIVFGWGGFVCFNKVLNCVNISLYKVKCMTRYHAGHHHNVKCSFLGQSSKYSTGDDNNLGTNTAATDFT